MAATNRDLAFLGGTVADALGGGAPLGGRVTSLVDRPLAGEFARRMAAHARRALEPGLSIVVCYRDEVVPDSCARSAPAAA